MVVVATAWRDAAPEARTSRVDLSGNAVCDAPVRPDAGQRECLPRQRAIEGVDPATFDDAQLLQRLTDEGGSLIETHRTVDARILAKQLEIDTCELKLPEAATAGSADNSANSATASKSLAETIQVAREGVVIVASIYKCPRCDKWHAAPASGFVLTADGVIVTSYHVIAEQDKATYVVMTASGHVYPVTKVLAGNEHHDLALLKIEAENLRPLPLGKSPEIGDSIGVLSHPAGHFYSFSSGVVSRKTRVRVTSQPVDAIQVTADFARGSSGAPVLNAQGQVIGIVRSTESVYYHFEQGQQRDLQMVFKVCIPASSLRRLTRS
jgi:S1-C subfamily serine protease